MPETHSTIDLEGFQRLHSLERRLGRSPIRVGLGLAAWCALLTAGVCGIALVTTEPFFDDRKAIALSVAAFVSAAFAGLSRAYQFYLLARLRCPQCGRRLTRHIADLTETEWRRWWPRGGVYLGGCLYARPFDAELKEPWVCVMKEVRACVPCLRYLEYKQPYQKVCSEEELEQITQYQSQTKSGSRA